MVARILIADHHQIFRKALRILLQHEGFEVVAEAADGPEAVQHARQLKPDLAIVDFAVAWANGINPLAEIRRASPKTRTLLLTSYADGLHVEQALDSGVNGYVLHNQPWSDLRRAIAAVVQGGRYLSPGISEAVLDAYAVRRRRRCGSVLTAREREVLQLIGDGKSTKQIATLLGVSFKTAESHRRRIMQKLDVHNTVGLVRYAIGRGLLPP